MSITDPSLRKAIHHAVGMSPAEMLADPAEYVHRFVEAGMAVIEVRQRMAGETPADQGKRK